MSLITYSDSDDDSDIDQSEGADRALQPSALSTNGVQGRKRKTPPNDTPKQRRPPPPPPSNFNSLYATSSRTATSDDPSLHAGRQRQTPHMEGNWPSFVYLEWTPTDSEIRILDDIITSATEMNQVSALEYEEGRMSDEHRQILCNSSQARINSSLRSDLGVRLPLHVSLSSPLILTTSTKDAFMSDLTAAIHKSRVSSFSPSSSKVKWVSNFDGSRHFLIVTLNRPEGDGLAELLKVCNQVAKEFGLPELYAGSTDQGLNVGVATTQGDGRRNEPAEEILVLAKDDKTDDHEKFHVSIAWSLDKPSDLRESAGDDEWKKKLAELKISISQVSLKMGNKITTIPLDE